MVQKISKNIFWLSLIILICLILQACKQNLNKTLEQDELISPILIDVDPVNYIMGQRLGIKEIKGEFDVSGKLEYVDPNYILEELGSFSFEWKFTPVDNSYTSMTGMVQINVYNHVLTFEEHGGFEIEDVYFNDFYTVNEKVITMKNEYRFDGWSEEVVSEEYIEFPYTITNSVTLHAGYRYHSVNELEYFEHGIDGRKPWAVRAIWGKNGYVEYPTYWYLLTHSVNGSISGEIIVADMYNNEVIEVVLVFRYTNIESIVLPNKVSVIGRFDACSNFGPDIVIPNSVLEIQSFINCRSLKEVIFESGSRLTAFNNDVFWNSGLEKIIFPDTIEIIGESAFQQSKLKEVIIPESVRKIGVAAFAGIDTLKQVIIKGNSLESIGHLAFALTPLKKIEIPELTVFSPTAFYGSFELERIIITENQISNILDQFLEGYIGISSDFTLTLIKGAQYNGFNLKGEYVANSKEIRLYYDEFSINALNTLIHEFFHYYQYVLCYGVEQNDFYSVPIRVGKFSTTQFTSYVPIFVVPNEQYLDAHGEPYYLRVLDDLHFFGRSYVLVDEELLNKWRQPYIPLLTDQSNYEAYWNQPFEQDARWFASHFTGISYN